MTRDTLIKTILILGLSVFTAIIVLYAPPKLVAIYSLLPILIIFLLAADPLFKIVIPLILITFPIILQVFGKDAFSTGTVSIILSLGWAMFKIPLFQTFQKNRFIIILLLLIAGIGFVGMISKTPDFYWGPAVRHYVNLISSICLFILIIHTHKFYTVETNAVDYSERIISAIIYIVFFHIILSFLVLNYPWFGKYFTIFLPRTQEVFSETITRARTIFTGGEEFGELLILIFPFVMYKLITSKGKIYFIILLFFIFGTIITGTRSAMILIVLQSIVYFYYFVPNRYKRRKINITFAFLAAGIICLPVVYKYGPIVFDRMLETLEHITKEKSVYTISNREMVWPIAYQITTRTLSLFGHGPVQAHIIGFQTYNFHSLYLSLIFQFGVLGFALFMFFFFFMAKRLYQNMRFLRSRKGRSYLLCVSCLLSLVCFLINEIKFEFNREDSYQQIVWAVFAVFYLAGNISIKRKNEEAHHH